jgi:3-oxoacyl-[acyl-carrier-protein] synthase II
VIARAGRPSERVVITGGGAISPFGAGIDSLLDGVMAGRTALSAVTTDEVSATAAPARPRSPTCAALLRSPLEPGPFNPNAWRRLDRCSKMAVIAAREAMDASGWLAGGGRLSGSGRLSGDSGPGLVLGTMTAGTDPLVAYLGTILADGPEAASPMIFPFTVPNAPASQGSILLGLKGPNLTVCQMEASGLGAIATAVTLLRSGAAEAVLAGGVDEYPVEIDRAWSRLRITARGDPASFRGPFDAHRRGFAPGEGAYLLALETLERVRSRGARPWAEVLAVATRHVGGAAHRWPGDPGEAAACLKQALLGGGLAPADLGYIASSANGSRALDETEARSLRMAFGRDLLRIPVTTVKGSVGESGAASACAALVAALSIRDGFMPAIAGLHEPAPDIGLNLVMSPRREPVPAVLVNALGTGGSCVSLVLSRPIA